MVSQIIPQMNGSIEEAIDASEKMIKKNDNTMSDIGNAIAMLNSMVTKESHSFRMASKPVKAEAKK